MKQTIRCVTVVRQKAQRNGHQKANGLLTRGRNPRFKETVCVQAQEDGEQHGTRILCISQWKQELLLRKKRETQQAMSNILNKFGDWFKI